MATTSRAAAIGGLIAISLFTSGCGASARQRGDSVAVGKVANDGVRNARRGGHLTYLTAGDVDFIDPGQLYTTLGAQVAIATNRPLYSYRPADSNTLVPDLASGPPKISADDRSITVHIRSGIHYSPPLQQETVKAQDVKYAFERAFTKQVPNGYVAAYFGSLVGAPARPNTGNYRPISGIKTPNDTTIVFNFTKPVASFLATGLVMPVSVPVPKSYALKFDQQFPSTYNFHTVFTGPYMIRHSPSGLLTGYQPGKEIDLVRNPSWNPRTDYRPAYLDSVTIREGNDLNLAGLQALKGSGIVCCDTPQPPSAILELAEKHYPEQLYRVPSAGWQYTALNTTIPPLNNLDVRRAIYAALNRTALRKTLGGSAIGPVATGFISPGMPGFAESGGFRQGAQYDFNRSLVGDPALATRYMLRARAEDPSLPISATGKWTADTPLILVGDNAGPGLGTALLTRDAMASLGFQINFVPVSQDAIYTKFCTVPSMKVAICADLEWLRIFPDSETLLDPTFNEHNITQTNNNNKTQLNDPTVNAAIAAGETAVGQARGPAWAHVNNLVIGTASAIPLVWADSLSVASKNVDEAVSDFFTGPDLDFTSLS